MPKTIHLLLRKNTFSFYLVRLKYEHLVSTTVYGAVPLCFLNVQSAYVVCIETKSILTSFHDGPHNLLVQCHSYWR